MDRLEKALEKSRLQRAAHMSLSYVQSMDVPGANSKSGSAAAPSSRVAAYTNAPAGIGVVDEGHLERHRIVAHQTRSREADIYRQLRTQVLHIMNASGLRTLAITSPHYNDGKTTVSINLGVSMALDVKQTVMLVDLDLRKPNLHEYMGMESSPGLTDYLLYDVPIQDCLMRLPFDRVTVLPAGDALDNSSELLGLPKMAALAHELKTRYPDRMVIYDMPPVLAQDDPLTFLPHVDAVLVVIRDGVTRTDDLKRCLKILSGTNVIGTVLNNSW